jgi:replicative DNA helicase
VRAEDLIMAGDKILERQVLCHIMLSKCIPPSVIPEYFEGAERRLFDAILIQIQKTGVIDTKILRGDHHATIHECMKTDATATPTAIDGLHGHFVSRGIGAACLSLGDWEDPVAAARELQNRISDVLMICSDKKYSHETELSAMVAYLERAAKADRSIAGYSTGLSNLDKITSGIEAGKVYALGALKKTGKSRFALYLSLQLILSGARVFWNSLEMSRMRINLLAVSFFSSINSNVFGRAMTKQQYHDFAMAMEHVKALNWVIYKEPTVSELRSRIQAEKQNGPVDCVIVDYIQRMQSPKFPKDRTREVEDISLRLADMARDENVALIELSQLQGAAERLDPDEVPNMSHYKESGGISESADSIWTLHSNSRHETTFTEGGEYAATKFRMRVEQRDGVSGEIVNFDGDMRICRFSEERDSMDDRRNE